MSLTPFDHHHPAGHRNAILDPFAMASTLDPFNRQILPSDMTTSSLVNTSIDWKETSDAHIFKADLPGIQKEEVKVELEEERVLLISGERNREVEESSDRWHRVERSSGKFVRRFRLPENVKMDQINASMEHGVLTVTIPKEQPRDVKAIQISN